MKKFLKTLICLMAFILILLITPLHINANTEHFYHIKASVGENATSVGINWHSDLSGSKLYLATNEHMLNYAEFDVNERTYSKGTTNGQTETIFAERYIGSVNLTNLELNTKYYYQVVNGENKSIVCSFKTANSVKTTFGVLCDTQASGSNFQYSDQLVKKLYSINNDINFFITAGDIVDRGGYEAQWHALDQYMPFLSHQNLQATIPGNHELYHSSLASYEDASIYNQFFNNPKNGIEKRTNSSYYFKYNDTLFIMLDTMNRSNGDSCYEEQVAWFKDVVSNNHSKFIIVVTHPGCYSTGIYADDAKRMNGIWRNVFEEYGVDLAISGHEHVYARTKQIYQDKEDTEKGVTYVIGGGAGSKRYSGKNNGFFAEVINGNNTNPSGFYAGSIVEIIGDTLSFKFYDINGTLLDEFSIKTKVQDTSNFNVETFLNNVHVEFNEVTFKNHIVWDKNAYGNIKDISVFVEHKNVTVSKYIGPGSSEIMVADGSPIRDYKYDCTFTDYNGNTYKKTIEVKNDPEPLKPKDYQVNITEIEKGKFEVTIDYDINKGVFKFAFLNIGNERITILNENKQTFNYSEAINKDDISLQFVYTLYGTEISDIIDNDKITYNITLLENNNNNNNNGSNCNLGIGYVTTLIGACALFLLIYKRK